MVTRMPLPLADVTDTPVWFVFGATVGIIAGRTVTRHGREFPVTVTAIPGGALIVYTRRPTASPAS